eukprot:COSAG02_NODE_1318_length_13293_cov_39.414886_3_plen_60_part_00
MSKFEAPMSKIEEQQDPSLERCGAGGVHCERDCVDVARRADSGGIVGGGGGIVGGGALL